ncbi:MAG: hypothetical protein WC725_01640 [Patescibacteria group bacterium]|jgi:hypothetical protein
MATQVNIVDGPSKFDLMLALFENRTRPPKTLYFRCQRDDKMKTFLLSVNITSLTREDASAESWKFEGCFTSTQRPVSGQFRTDTRKGYVLI